jgi:hypothetical protein
MKLGRKLRVYNTPVRKSAKIVVAAMTSTGRARVEAQQPSIAMTSNEVRPAF